MMERDRLTSTGLAAYLVQNVFSNDARAVMATYSLVLDSPAGSEGKRGKSNRFLQSRKEYSGIGKPALIHESSSEVHRRMSSLRAKPGPLQQGELGNQGCIPRLSL